MPGSPIVALGLPALTISVGKTDRQALRVLGRTDALRLLSKAGEDTELSWCFNQGVASLRRLGRRFRLRRSPLIGALLLPLVVVVDGGAVSTPAQASPSCWVGAAVVRGNAWYLAPNYGTGVATRSFGYGTTGDVPFFGHWDGKAAQSAPGVVRGRTWYLRRSQTSGPAEIAFAYGRTGDIPVVGDWNGDGIDTPGVVRGRTWYLRNSNTPGPADVSFTFNAPGTPTVEFGLGYTWAVTFDAGTWYVRQLQTSGPANFTEHFGQAGDIPLAGGLYIPAPDCTSPSFAVVRGNVWHISGNGGPDAVFGFGHPGDRFLGQHY